MNTTLIKNVQIVNEGKIINSDLRIRGEYIDKIAPFIPAFQNEIIFEGNCNVLLPGMIDDQVHFREPGLTHKGTISTESQAAVAGGITSFMDMPNTNPATTTIDLLERKYAIAERCAMANYSFYLGATENNLEEIKRLDPTRHCGVKVFMGASTGNLLVENTECLDAIFRESPVLITTHCENQSIISKNLKKYSIQNKIPTIIDHPKIRNADACYASSSYAVNLAKSYGSMLHVLHISTEKELELFQPGPTSSKKITAEACVHHLWFSDDDYPRLGNLIKCNPAIKQTSDRDAIIKAIIDNRIDIIATDHAPHLLDEKKQDYNLAPAGLPLVEHALLTLLDHVKHERLSLEQVVEKTAHNPATRYKIQKRGYLREGYYADFVLVNLNKPFMADHKNVHYICGWTPFENHTFSASIQGTWVNGVRVYDGVDLIRHFQPGQRLNFNI